MLEVSFDERKIDAVFAHLDQCHLPGAAVGIAVHGKPVYRKAFGLANMELPLVLTPATRMRLGSTTKHFTAIACLLLCEQGKASVDDPVTKHLPELHPVAQTVTLRQLMGNISGLRDACAIRGQFSGHIGPNLRQVTSGELLSLYRDLDGVDAQPGTTWIYNNGGWVILSAAIERIAAQPMEDFMREQVFEPLGMFDSMVRRWDTDFVPNSASPHQMLDGAYRRLYFGFDYAGGGFLVSTVNDMLRWTANMDTHRVGNGATWALMRTPMILANSQSTGYGMGLCIDRYRGVEAIHHSGGWVGSSTQVLKVPAAGLDIVIIANRYDANSPLLTDKVLDALLPGLAPVEASAPSALAHGTYRSPTSGRVIRLLERGGQQLVSLDGTDLAVETDAQGVLWICGLLRFKQGITRLGDLRKPTALRFSDFGNVDEFVPVSPVRDPDAVAIVGTYRSSDGTHVTITILEGTPQMLSAGRFGSMRYRLEPLSEAIWQASTEGLFVNGILSFERGYDGFLFSSHFIRALRFRRIG
jgi:D-aminopeptidase